MIACLHAAVHSYDIDTLYLTFTVMDCNSWWEGIMIIMPNLVGIANLDGLVGQAITRLVDQL